MRKFKVNSIIGLALLTMLSTSSFADEYYCKDAYQAKLARIEKNHLVRNIAKGTLTLGLVTAGIVVPIVTMGSGVAGAAIFTSLITAPAGQGLGDLIDREEGLRIAKEFIEISQINREELKESLYNEFIENKHKEILRGSGVLTTLEQVKEGYPISSFKLHTIVDSTLDTINKKRMRNKLKAISYEEFQLDLKEKLQTDLFCRKRPETIRKITKLLKKQI